ncbi:MAG: DNA repair protein RadC [Thermodesulfobacteriota bacterium]|nr:DNA repair protein RadC [Thermodesulfobacteriota bacterium]
MTTKTPNKGAGHRQRLREKFLTAGLSGFHDYEVVELLLTLGTPVRDCKEPAKVALATFGTLQGVMEASTEELCQIKGIGPKNALGIKLIKAVADRYLQKRVLERPLIGNSTQLLDFLNHTIRDKAREVFLAVFLDAKNRVLGTDVMSEGTVTESPVYVREIVRRAMDKNAAALICCHNHPSGDATPSKNDIAITQRLAYACRTMGIVLHEHLIIADQGHYSFVDNGEMARINRHCDKIEAGIVKT